MTGFIFSRVFEMSFAIIGPSYLKVIILLSYAELVSELNKDSVTVNIRMGDDMTANPLPILPLPVQRRLVERGSQKGKGIAVFTSGGDSQGMNAAVRAVVRFELSCQASFVYYRVQVWNLPRLQGLLYKRGIPGHGGWRGLHRGGGLGRGLR